MEDRLRFIPLHGRKGPTETFKESGGRTFAEVRYEENIGMIVPEGYLVLDFDDEDSATRIMNIIEGEALRCRILQTTRGVHVWFRNKQGTPLWKNRSGERLAIGLHADIRQGGKACYVVLRRDGINRDWLDARPFEEIDEIPGWMFPVKTDDYQLVGMTDGDGRNDTLLRYKTVMRNRGLSIPDTKRAMEIINDYIFDEPLPLEELRSLMREEAFLDTRPPVRIKSRKREDDEPNPEEAITDDGRPIWFTDRGRFLHDVFGRYLIGREHVVNVNGTMYIYKNGYYSPYLVLLERAILETDRTLTSANRRETLEYLRIHTSLTPDEIRHEEEWLNVKNGRLNVLTGELTEHSPKFHDFQQVPTNYRPEARCEALDETLESVFCGDDEIIELFEEIVGYCLLKSNRYRKGFLFLGGGSNGKSTILNLIRDTLGHQNTSAVEMKALSDRFKTAEMENMLANIGDDISSVDHGHGHAKFSPRGVDSRAQGGPFILHSYAKQLFSANEMPRIADKSHGMYDRLVIHRSTRPSVTDRGWNPHIDTLLKESGRGRHLARAVRSPAPVARGFFNEPVAVKDEPRNTASRTRIRSRGSRRRS